MSPPEDTQPLPPIAGRYELQRVIGEGGVSTVYLARDRKLNRDVAVKRMNREPDQKERELVEQAWRETMAATSLKHPNIARTLDFGFEPSGAYIVMEYIEGENLEQCLERGPLHLDDFYRFTKQSLDALAVAHDHRLLHRDLKPGNFMIQNRTSHEGFLVKILDFGLAKFVNAPRPQSTDHMNTVMGSVYYMAPEQFRRLPSDQRTDLYSFGCILYEALTGYSPFYGETVAAIIEAHIKDQPQALRSLRSEVAPALEEWVMRFLKKDPDERPKSAGEALKTLPAP